MGTTEIDTKSYVTNTKTTYTFNEAIEYMKRKDRNPTRINQTVRWKDSVTGNEVYIGYTN